MNDTGSEDSSKASNDKQQQKNLRPIFDKREFTDEYAGKGKTIQDEIKDESPI